jgi:hypothetical protein
MKQIEQDISILVENHFPEFYKENGDNFIAFVKEYYDWALQTNNHLYHSRKLLDYRDIDETVEGFLYHFEEKYLKGAPVSFQRSRFDIKHIIDIYRSKGTEQGTKLFFNRVFGDPSAEVYFPGSDVLRASDGQWYVPKYLEVEIAEKTSSFLGRLITGSASGATAFVEGVNRKSIDGKYIDVIYLSGINGTFQFGEIITQDGVLQGCPKVVGSLTSITLSETGRNFSVGDVVDIISSRRGKLGKAVINDVGTTTGKVTFTLNDGGSGYRLSTNAEISEKVLIINNIVKPSFYVNNFAEDEIVYQPLINVVFTTSNNFFSVGSLVTGSNSSADLGTARVINTTQKEITGTVTSNSTSNVVIGVGTNFNTALQSGDHIRFQSNNTIFQIRATDGITNATHLYLTTNGPDTTANTLVRANGTIQMVPVSGSFSSADRIKNTTGLITSVTNSTAYGTVMGVNSTAIGLINISRTFTSNGYNYIYGGSSGVQANVTTVSLGSTANFDVGSLTDEETVFLNTDIIGSNNSITLTGLTGTVDSNTTSAQVNGTSTLFTTEIYRGDYVKFSGNSSIFQVNNVVNNTVLILTTNSCSSVANSLSRSNGSYTSLPLDSYRYGFPKLPSANLSFILNTALETDTFQIGTIASLTNINPGTDYNVTPFVRVRDTAIAGFNRRDLHLEVNNQTGTFVTEEEIVQNFSTPSVSMLLTGSTTAFTLNESITQDIGASNSYGLVATSNTTFTKLSSSDTFVGSTLQTVATGTVTSNSTSPQVNGTTTTFTTDFAQGDFIKFSGSDLIFQVDTVSNNTILNLTSNSVNITGANTIRRATEIAVGLTSGIARFVNTVTSDSILSLSRGKVLSSDKDDGYVNVKRKTFNQSFTPGVSITGTTSGATANVISVTQIAESSLMGYNANVGALAGTVSGSIVDTTVINSGYAYEENELITISKAGNQYVATGLVKLTREGTGEGRFLSTRGFLNSDKYIHDGDYYQAFSYEVRSSLGLEVYSETLKKLLHVAGTKLFGKVVRVSSANTQITTNGVITTIS